MVSAPHFLLQTETHADSQGGRWRFALRRDTGRLLLEAADVEPGLAGPRLELLAAVRGLEALEFPSRITLVTASNYVRRGIDYGLDSWRQNDWTWEWFGHMVPVKNRDLWQRIDRALTIHQVTCRRWRIDPPHAPAKLDRAGAPRIVVPDQRQIAAFAARESSHAWRRGALRRRRWLAEHLDSLRLKIAQLGTELLPQPWLG